MPESLEFVWIFVGRHFLKFSRKIGDFLEFSRLSGICFCFLEFLAVDAGYLKIVVPRATPAIVRDNNDIEVLT